MAIACEMGVVDVARRRGWHRNTARAWLKDIEAKYGATVVYRRRGRLYTTDKAIAPFWVAAPDPRLVGEVHGLDERVREVERRLDAHVRESGEFRRQALGWFRRLEALERKAAS